MLSNQDLFQYKTVNFSTVLENILKNTNIKKEVTNELKKVFNSLGDRWGSGYKKKLLEIEYSGEDIKKIINSINNELAIETAEELILRNKSSSPVGVSPVLSTLLGNLLDSKNPQVERIVKQRFEDTIKQELSKCPTLEAKLSCIEGARMAFDFPYGSRSESLRKLYNETIWKYKNEDWFKLVLDRGLVREEENQFNQASDMNLASDENESALIGEYESVPAA